MQEKTELSSMSETKVELNQHFRSLFRHKNNATIKNLKNELPGVAKSWDPAVQGWHLLPHAAPWLRVWSVSQIFLK